MRIYKKTKGYFYKEYKNGKKIRISKDKYLKHKKIKQIGGIGYNNCVIHAHGSYYTVMNRFPIPSNIRLITTTIKGFYLRDVLEFFLPLLSNDAEHFKNTDNGVAITKKGMQLQKQLRSAYSLNNHQYQYMMRLVPVKQSEEYRDILLSFAPEKNNSGIYVYLNRDWIFYEVISASDGISLVQRKVRANCRPEILEVPLSKILTLLNDEAIRLKTNFNVYLNACNYGELTNELIKENRELLNRRRRNTMEYNLTLNEKQRSGVTNNKTRTLHFNKNFFNNGYFEQSLSNLPKKDKKLLSNRFKINTEKDWEEIRTDTNFQISYKLIHSRFELGRKKNIEDMTPEELKAITNLGFTTITWDSANSNVNESIFNTPFDELSEKQRAAAKTLGYTKNDFFNKNRDENVGGGKNKKSCKIAKRKLTKKKKTPAAKKKKRVRKIHKGPRGGRYYIRKGRKVYI